jgi:hypothetical protein
MTAAYLSAIFIGLVGLSESVWKRETSELQKARSSSLYFSIKKGGHPMILRFERFR